MASDIRRTVQTDFAVDASKASGPLQALSSQMSGLGSVVGAATGAVAAMGAALAGAGILGGLKQVAKLHSEFEDTKIALAGMFSALGVSKDFSGGLQDAAEAQKAITLAAAKLPGEAEDYIAVFRAGLPSVRSAIGGALKDSYKFTNQLTAVTSSLQISSEQVARDLPRLLAAEKGGAGARNVTFRQLLPFMQKLPKQADLTAEKFNKMSQQARGALLQQLLNGKELSAMVDASADTWSAQAGALASNARMLLRDATGPLFEGMKGGLKFVNDLLYDSDGEMTLFSARVVSAGKLVSSYLVSGFKAAFAWAEKIGDALEVVGKTIASSPAFARLEAYVTKAGAAVGGVSAPALGGNTPGGQAVGALGGIGDKLSRLLDPMLTEGLAVSAVFGDLASGVLPGLLSAVDSLLGPIVTMASGFYGIVTAIATTLRPTLAAFGSSVGNLVQAVGTYLHPILRLLGAGLILVYRKFVDQLLPAVDLVIKGFTEAFNFIAKYLNKVGVQTNALVDKVFGAEETGGEQAGLLDGIMKAIEAQRKQDEAKEKADKASNRETPGARGGAKTVQDFRNSRFDITQKFAEGYDPDRVAVAFAHDLGRVGEQKLQSGHEPAFGIR